jgi:alpha-mannosidase
VPIESLDYDALQAKLEHSYVSVKQENVVLTALKKAEDSDGLIFRAYEWSGREEDLKIQVPPGATDATVVNLLEKPEGNPIPVVNGELNVPIHPYEILTIRVNYPNHAQGK